MACFLFECSTVIGTTMPGARSVTISVEDWIGVEGGADAIGGETATWKREISQRRVRESEIV